MKPAVKQRRKSWKTRERKAKLDYRRPVIQVGGWTHHYHGDPPWYLRTPVPHDGGMTDGWALVNELLTVRLCIVGLPIQMWRRGSKVAELYTDGRLTMWPGEGDGPGYEWNGMSHPLARGATKNLVETEATLVPSAVHDFLYWAHRMRLLPYSYRWVSDAIYRDLFVAEKKARPGWSNGNWRAHLHWAALRVGGRRAAEREPYPEDRWR